MATRDFARLARAGFFAALALALLLHQAGCQQSGGASPGADAATTETRTAGAGDSGKARKLLDEMVRTYRDAKSYEDAGELFVAVEAPGGQRDQSPPIPFSVTLERPNKIRIHALDANIIAGGDKLRATINSLEEQILSLPVPATLTLGNLVADDFLVAAMRGQIDVDLPQLVLLLGADPLKQLSADGTPKLLGDADCQDERCQRVAFDTLEGQTVLWISPKTHLLMKIEFPTKAFQEKFSLAKAAIWAEMKGARINKSIVADAFKMDAPPTAKLLKRFMAPGPVAPSPLLGKTVDDFRLVDYRGGNVTRESLEGKIAVLDMWATWCGWCFKGFPNLQQVYDQFKDNDKVVILAVNKDDPNVSDAEVKKSFEDKGLSIPIVRDQRQMTDAVFQVPGLPTMVILGPNGALEEHHVGYDEKLAETLPKKIQRLLAGDSLAKDELERYNEARRIYDQQLFEARSE